MVDQQALNRVRSLFNEVNRLLDDINRTDRDILEQLKRM